MAPRPQWWHTLQEGRRQACVAIDFYNRSGDKASFRDFVMHMHVAWLHLLHADLLRGGGDIYYRERNGRFSRGKDGEKRAWELQKCLKEEFSDNHPTRVNIEFFISLRNRIEHRYQRALMMETAAQAHALVINFETELVQRFGTDESLGAELRFPVFVQSLTPTGMDEQRAVRKRLPASVRSFITQFEANLDPDVKEDERYLYRVLLTPVKGPKTEADMAFAFVRQDQLTAEQMQDMIEKSATVVIAEKHRNVALADEMLPGKAAAAIEAQIPFKFSTNDFTKLRQAHEVGPKKGKPGAKTEDRYCIYSNPHEGWVYTPAYVERCVQDVNDEKKFKKALGRSPVRKLTNIDDRKKRVAS